MKDYHLLFIDYSSKWINFKDKTILEVGCGNGEMLKEIDRRFNPKEIVGINSEIEGFWKTNEEDTGKIKIIEADIRSFDYPDEYFDHIITVATFEHINNLDVALENMKRLLKPTGRIYTFFSPIWTSIIGHHYNFWVSAEEAKIIPPWGHLWMNEEEMYSYLKERVNEQKAKDACNRIYHSSSINRLGRRDFYEIIQNSGFLVREMKEQILFNRARYYGELENEMTEEIYNKLKDKYSIADLGVVGFEICLEKYKTLSSK